VVKAQKAAKGIIVTSGTFSSDAEPFCLTEICKA